MISCRTCPCDSRRDHVDQQQYPRVVRIPATEDAENALWMMVYEYRASLFLRTSLDGLNWSGPAQLPQTGIWQTWLMPCRDEESIGTHPFASDAYDCLAGGPPGIAVSDEGQGMELYVFAGLDQNPGGMGCYRGQVDGSAALMRKCNGNPLFVGSPTNGDSSPPGAQDNPHFDFRTISSAEVTRVDDRSYMLYEGVRGPQSGASGDTQFALGMARSVSP